MPLLRDAPVRPHTFPVTAEFTNWRSEQRAWRDTVALLDQSHHMTDLFVHGPGALAVLSELGVNRFDRFVPGQAKQFIAVNEDGHLIGDAILFHLGPDRFDLVGHPMVLDWVQFRLETGDDEASFERDDNSLVRRHGPPALYRYELQGPAAVALVERLVGGPLGDVRFFHTTELAVAGRPVTALRHGMAGQPGFELFGPWADGAAVLEAVLEAGAALGLVRAGAKAYSTANLESGWVPAPLPAIFDSPALASYRAWLPATAAGSLGGSLRSDRIEDYYCTPYDLGYGHTVHLGHEFVGRDALAAMGGSSGRRKVTLVWHPEDVTALLGSLFEEGLPAKYLELPKARYALYQADEVRHGGRRVGMSMDCGYAANEHAFLSLATLDEDVAVPGTEVEVRWGEEPNSRKPQVEPHRQVGVRATVATAPYAAVARGGYRTSTLAELRAPGQP